MHRDSEFAASALRGRAGHGLAPSPLEGELEGRGFEAERARESGPAVLCAPETLEVLHHSRRSTHLDEQFRGDERLRVEWHLVALLRLDPLRKGRELLERRVRPA